jgi:thiosulfate reductase cytochrome b subunit
MDAHPRPPFGIVRNWIVVKQIVAAERGRFRQCPNPVTEEEKQQREDMRKHWDDQLKKAEARANSWKYAAIFGILFLLWIIAVLKGWIPLR